MIDHTMLTDDRLLRAWAIEQARGDTMMAKKIEAYVIGDGDKTEQTAAAE